MQLSSHLLPARLLSLTILLLAPIAAVGDTPVTPGTIAAIDERGIVEHLPLRHTSVSIEVSGFVARATVEQVFVNPFERPIEAVYTFPLGHEAAVDEFELQSGDRVVRGEVHRRAEARRIYQAAQSEGRQAALLEQERPNIFTQSVANLMPDGEVRVRLRTVEVLDYDAGVYQLTFPLVVGPRYVPGEMFDAVDSALQAGEAVDTVSDPRCINPPTLPRTMRSGHDVDIRVTLEPGVPLHGVTSVSHEVEILQEEGAKALVSLSPVDRIPNKDFILRWSVSSEDPAAGMLAHRQGVDGYFAFIVQPRGIVEVEQASPKEILFVLDTSGSMSGLPLRMSKAFIHDALQSLASRDSFNLIRFASGSATFSKESLDGTKANVRRALHWVNSLQGGGGTEMLKGLKRAMSDGGGTDRYRMIVFLTDGFIGNDNEILARIKELPGDVRVFTVGIGSSVNHSLLDGMAKFGGGAYTFIADEQDSAVSLERFTGWVTRPYLTDLEIDWGALPVGDWIPEIPRDLFSGQNLTIVGRYFGGAQGAVMVRGRLAGSYWEAQLPVDLPDEEPRHGGLASIWARSRIQLLLDESPGNVSERNREEVIELALEHELMSPFTSFVAVDYDVVNPGGESETVLQPVPLPEGTSFEAASSGITIRVQDADQLPLPGATVTISHEAGNVATTAQLTGRDGAAVFPVLRPGGGYSIEAAFPGFNTIRLDGLRVESGEGRLYPVQMIEEFQERVKVVAEAAVVDLSRSSQSTRFSESFISDLPVPGRFYQNVMSMSPGVQDADGDGRPNIHGSRSRDFQAVVNGVSNVDPLTGPWMSRINPNSIEEMEVITAGAGVEFGRAQGGFARIIQKQGSNTHEGTVRMEAESGELDSVGVRDAPTSYDGARGGFNLSGPVAKDRLWYRLSHEWSDWEDPVRAGRPVFLVPQKNESHSDMLTWQVAPRNKLVFEARRQSGEIRGLGVSSFVRPEVTPRIDSEVRGFSVSWIAPYSPRILVETVLSKTDTEVERMPSTTAASNGCVNAQDPFLGSAECLDLVVGAQTGVAHLGFSEDRDRLALESSASIWAGRVRGVSHQIKLGMELGLETHDRAWGRAPDLVRLVDGRATLVVARSAAVSESISDAEAGHWSLFAEDQLKPMRNLTLTVGLRLDSEWVEGDALTLFNPRAEHREFLSKVGDLIGDERLELAGSVFTAPADPQAFLDGVAGQVGEDLCCSDPVLSSDLAQVRRAPEWLKLSRLNFSPFFSIKWSPWDDGHTAFSFAARRYYDELRTVYLLAGNEPPTADLIVEERESFVRPSIQMTDPNLKTPHQDEWSLGFERELFAETSIGVTLVHRRFRDQIQYRELNHLSGGLYVQNPFWGDVFLLGNFGGGTYDGLTLELDRRLYRSWEMKASYTFSEARGSAEGFDPTLGDERTVLDTVDGFEPHDQRHVFKLHATVITPWALRLGGSVTWESGLPYSALEYRVTQDAIPPALAGLTESVPLRRLTYLDAERNRSRNDSVLNLDLRLAREFALGAGVRIVWSLDVLNALDDRTYRVYPGERSYGQSINGFDDATLRFGRRYQMGLEIGF